MSKQFTVGQRVKFNQPYAAIKAGDEGTIDRVSGQHVHVKMETGKRSGQVAVCYPFRVDEIKAEPKFKVGDKVRNLHDSSEEWCAFRGARHGDICTVIKVEPSNAWPGEQLIRLAEYAPGSPHHLRRASKYELVEEPMFKAGDLVTPNEQENDTRSFTRGKPYKVREYRPAYDGACGVLHFESDDQGYTGRFRPASYYERYVEPEASEPATEFRIRKHGTALREVRGIPFDSQEAAEQAVSRYTPGSVYEIVEVKVVRTVKVEQEVRVIDYKEAA
ncbi:hypothetical protein [Burkholderia sp. AU45388]|uniref:hypothetical protein n=1 Tax=Burkholderia sp. AU45388 TaxID=3059206 RepID=UPI0026559AD2|nr:hypothetical protein [Burkholderia sp. AU45388]MDN7427787.1 hypothetical protein [Burkholderia sp. AU45388]